MFGKKTVSAASVSVFLIVLMFSAMKASAQYSVGVKAGDWAGYGDVSVEFASNMTGYEDSGHPQWQCHGSINHDLQEWNGRDRHNMGKCHVWGRKP